MPDLKKTKAIVTFFALKLNSHSSDFFSQKRREGQFISQRQRPLWLLLYPCSWFSIKTDSEFHLIDIEWELKIEISRGRYWSSSFDFGSELNIQMNRGGQGSFSIDNIRIEHWNEQRRAVFNPNWCWTRIENWNEQMRAVRVTLMGHLRGRFAE